MEQHRQPSCTGNCRGIIRSFRTTSGSAPRTALVGPISASGPSNSWGSSCYDVVRPDRPHPAASHMRVHPVYTRGSRGSVTYPRSGPTTDSRKSMSNAVHRARLPRQGTCRRGESARLRLRSKRASTRSQTDANSGSGRFRSSGRSLPAPKQRAVGRNCAELPWLPTRLHY